MATRKRAKKAAAPPKSSGAAVVSKPKIVRTKTGLVRWFEGKRIEVVRIPKTYSRDRKTGKRKASSWTYVSKTGFRLKHLKLEKNEKGEWKKPASRLPMRQSGKRPATKVDGRLAREEYEWTKVQKGGFVSYSYSRPTGLKWDSPLHTEDIVGGMLRKFLIEKDKELTSQGKAIIKWRTGVYFRNSKKNKEGTSTPLWHKELVGLSVDYEDSLQDALDKVSRRMQGVFQQNKGSQGSGRIWVQALFLEFKVEEGE